MKFRIEDREYDAQAAVENMSLQTLVDLKRSSGIGIKTLVESVKEFKKFKSPLDLLDSLEALDAFRILIWLSRRNAGEDLTMEEANSFPLNKFALIVDDAPAETVPDDPKALTDSVVEGETVPEGRTRRTTSRTSKRQ